MVMSLPFLSRPRRVRAKLDIKMERLIKMEIEVAINKEEVDTYW